MSQSSLLLVFPSYLFLNDYFGMSGHLLFYVYVIVSTSTNLQNITVNIQILFLLFIIYFISSVNYQYIGSTF